MKMWLTVVYFVLVISNNYSQDLLDLFSGNLDSTSLKLEMIKEYLAEGISETNNYSEYKFSFSEADVDYIITVCGNNFGNNREILESVNIQIKYNNNSDLPPYFKKKTLEYDIRNILLQKGFSFLSDEVSEVQTFKTNSNDAKVYKTRYGTFVSKFWICTLSMDITTQEGFVELDYFE